MEWTKGNEYQGNLVVGQRVHSILYGGRDGIISEIHGQQEPGSIRSLGGGCVVMGGRASFDVIFPEYISRGVPESIVRGVQWRIYEDVVTAEEIRAAIDTANAAVTEKKRIAQEKAEAQTRERLALSALFPYLTPTINNPKSIHSIGAKNIREELKRAFPGVKFSVKSESYSGGSSINVGWTDGPLTDDVKLISDKYQKCDFNGMEDLEEYLDAVWTDVFGGANYVFENRHESNELILKVAQKMGFKIGGAESDSMGNIWGLNGEQSQMIYRQARQTRA